MRWLLRRPLICLLLAIVLFPTGFLAGENLLLGITVILISFVFALMAIVGFIMWLARRNDAPH